MVPPIPLYIPATFILVVLVTLLLFIRILLASNASQKNSIIIIIITWIALQGVVSYSGFYIDSVGNIPPPFTYIGIIPAFVLMAIVFATQKGRQFIDSLPLFELTLLSTIRLPVEFVLHWLYSEKQIPEAMTFEGYNFDIIVGITAPVIAHYGFKKNSLGSKSLLAWNYLGLILLSTIIILSVFAFPSFVQKYAFDQPNRGMLYFPFYWLPSFIVPFVFFSHLVAIRKLTKGIKK